MKRNFRKNIYLYAAWTLVVFNIWHISSRSFWPGSIRECLGIGPNTIELAKKSIPNIEILKPYDGQFYFAMAHDPFLLNGNALPYVDVPAYRYRRMLYSSVAWLLSGGQERHLVKALFMINILSWVFIGLFAWFFARKEDLPIILTLLGFLGVSGLQFAVFRTLTEPMALAFILWGLWHLEKKNWWGGFLMLGAAGLTRETSVVTLISAAGFYTLRNKSSWRKIILLSLISFGIVISWNLYLPYRLSKLNPNLISQAQTANSVQLQPFSISGGGPGLTLPFVGFYSETKLFLNQNVTRRERIRTSSILIEFMALFLLALFILWQRFSLWGVLGFSEAIFCSLVRGQVWDFYAGSSRVIINLTIFVLAGLLIEWKRKSVALQQ